MRQPMCEYVMQAIYVDKSVQFTVRASNAAQAHKKAREVAEHAVLVQVVSCQWARNA
jgi:hypothetical protein